jgi:hypothetical protein
MRREPPWPAVTWRPDDPGTVGPFQILPPHQYRDRYRVGGTLRHVVDKKPLPFDILEVTVTDEETGAAVTFPKDGPASLVYPLDLSLVDLNRLWRVGPILAARARAELGRPSEAGERLEAIVNAVRDTGTSATRLRVGQILGRVDEWNVERSDYRRDVRDAGGWRAIKRRAGF